MPRLSTFLKHSGYIKIPLELTATNHLEVDALINGVPGRFILDTGASNTCVGLDKGDYFKLVTKDSDIKAAGAGATDMETQISKGNTITITTWVGKRREIVLFDLSHVNEALIMHEAKPVDGIIGADILKSGKAVIDYNRKVLYLKV